MKDQQAARERIPGRLFVTLCDLNLAARYRDRIRVMKDGVFIAFLSD